MGFQGISINGAKIAPVRQQVGFSGFGFSIDGLTPVMVQDSFGKGIPGVRIEAENTTSGLPFVSETDARGNALMQLDAATNVTATRWVLSETVAYTTSPQLIITLRSTLKI
jgi:hypothetical protein